MLTNIFGSKGEELRQDWRKLSPNTVRVSRSKRIRRTGHVARMAEQRLTYKVLVGKPERNHLEALGVYDRIILK